MRIFLFLFSVISLFSNPLNHAVVSGSANIKNVDENTLHIEASDRTILHWDTFSIGADELTKFIQPGPDAAVLNRVMSHQVSSILGKLEANGHVLLINPNGIIVGETGSIHTGSFTATTLDLLNEDFIQGKEFLFKGESTKAILNLGKIQAKHGDVVIASYKIDNQGEILAPNGTAALGASNEILLIPAGEEKILIRPQFEEEVGIQNSGAIEAIQVELKSHGTGYEQAIQHSGTIRAKGFVERNGKVLLVADEGSLVVSGKITSQNPDETGGDIHILGEKIALLDEANIDASGQFGGGTVLIGGDKQGSNPEISNAEYVVVAPDAKVHAHAQQNGDGGTVIFWSDGYTKMFGTSNVSGGPDGGDGGFIEISGKKGFDYRGTAERFAPSGKPGTLLLDPADVTCAAGAGPTVDGTFAGFPNTFTPTADPATVFIGPGAGTLITELAGGDLVIQTLGFGASPGDITVTGSITTGSANTLSFVAANDFIVGGGVTIDHDATLNITARDMNMVTGPASIEGTTLTVNINLSRDLNMTGSGGTVRLGNIGIANININARNANLMIGPNDVDLGNGATASFQLNLSGDLLLSGSGAQITVSPASAFPANIFIGGNATMIDSDWHIPLSPGNTVQINGNLNISNPLVQAGIAFRSSGNNQVTIGGNVTVDGGGAVGGGFGTGGFAPTDEVTIQAENFTFQNGANLGFFFMPPIPTTLIANDSINFNTGSTILNFFGPGGSYQFVVDNAFPTFPGIGPGAFNTDATFMIAFGVIDTIKVFSASRSQNSVDGTFVGGAPFVPGTFNVDTDTEIWNTYFPSALGTGVPVTFFYKDPAAVLLNPVVQQSITVAQTEMLRNFLEFEELIPMYMLFHSEIRERVNGQETFLETLPFVLRLRNYGTEMPKQVGQVLPY